MGAYAGIDYDSSAIHVVLIDEDTGLPVERHKFSLGQRGSTSFDRARLVRDVLPARARWRDTVVAVGLEVPFTIHKGTAVAYARIEGALLACLPPELRIHQLGPVEWKRLTLGDGKTQAKKPVVRAWAQEHGMPAGLEQDFYDAFCLAHATRVEVEKTAARAARQRGAA